MKKNEEITLTIQSIVSDGNGIGRHEGMAVFVPYTAPGDICKVKIVKVLKQYAFGILTELLTPGPDRIKSDCVAFGRCGGCSLRHISYEAELKSKQDFVQDAFRRLGGFEIAVEKCVPSPEAEHYRNKAQYPFVQLADGSVSCGFYGARSHRVVVCDNCLLQPVLLNQIAKEICAFLTDEAVSVYDEETRKGVLRHLYLRQGAHSGEIMVCIVVNANGLSCEKALAEFLQENFPQIKTLVINSNRENTNVILGRKFRTVFGDGIICDTLCSVPVTLAAPSFYQVNTPGAEQLYQIAGKLADVQKEELLLDLYCGTGTIGLSITKDGARLIGVEIIPEAVESAKANAAALGRNNAQFFCSDAGEAAGKLAAEDVHPDVIVLDPPRAGCDAATLAAVLKMCPSRIVMVSCNPATAARDAKALCAAGYDLVQVCPVDMFPRTKHVENVCLLKHIKE